MIRKRLPLVALVAALPMMAISASSANLDSEQKKLSYSMGFMTATAIKKNEISIDQDSYIAGFKSGMSGQDSTLTRDQMQSAIMNFQKQMQSKALKKRKTQADRNEKEGQAFLEKNKKNPNIKLLSSGVQYQVVKEGSGKSPTLSDSVTVNYKGTLLDGTIFDSSYQRNRPITFQVNGVIKGWQDALTHMKPGAKWVVFIPSDLAYGKHGVPGGKIGPNSVLKFDIELLSVNKK